MDLVDKLERVGRLFYIVSPNRTTFERIKKIPNYSEDAVPDLLALFLLEVCISLLLRKPNIRVNDTIACLSQGIIFHILRIFAPGGQLVTYNYVYSNWRIVDLPWNSPVTWWVTFLGADFAYYCLHRAAHEVNFLWATHQVHHSSEDYNISTNVRQSGFQLFYLWVLYIPLALIVPPSAFFVHVQFQQIYQYWIHTDLIKTLGPLEHILVTPSHHRVHHGANRDCIDKNFGGTLIIWDKLFGSFAKENGEIVYGLTQPVNSFEPIHIQFDHCVQMWRMFWKCEGWRNKLSVIFKGPGWSPGKPRLGDPKDIPDLKAPARKYDTKIPGWCKIYIILHFLLLIQGYLTIMKSYRKLPSVVLYGAVAYEYISLISIGILLDKSLLSPWIELLRCILFFVLDSWLQGSSSIPLTSIYARWVPKVMVHSIMAVSIVFWIIYCFIYHAFQTQKLTSEAIENNKMV